MSSGTARSAGFWPRISVVSSVGAARENIGALRRLQYLGPSQVAKRLRMKKTSIVFALIATMLACGFGSAAGELAPDGKRQAPQSAEPSPFPQILTREQWGAKPALPAMKAQKVSGVILHHTGVAKNPNLPLDAKMRGLQNFSQRPGRVTPTKTKPAWPDVPYHFYIDASGRIAEGRDVHFAGDTNTNYNTSGYIQIVIEGDFEKEQPDPMQLTAIRSLLVPLLTTWKLPVERISVHKDHAPTDCPGRNFMAALPSLLNEVANQLQQTGSRDCTQPPTNTRMEASQCQDSPKAVPGDDPSLKSRPAPPQTR
jgi:hypothetical protein